MNRNHWIDNCPDCDEVLRQFFLKKTFVPEDSAQGGWSGVEGYFCAGCDRLLIAVGFGPDDRETFWIDRASSGDHPIPASPPGRSHPCYLAGAIRTAAASCASGFNELRCIRAEMGPRRKPDDPRLTLAISDAAADGSAMGRMLDGWLTNTKSGRVLSQEHASDVFMLHIEMIEPVRARHLVDRLVRKFDLTQSARVYGYNEGRRYRSHQ